MKLFKFGAWIIGLMGVGGVAQAQFSSTVTATSDYDFRGFSQSASDPAIQGSLDYAFPTGFAIGAWASNVDFGNGNDADIELDLYASYTGKVSDTLSWSVGVTDYTYPNSDDTSDYLEFFAGVTSGIFNAKQWYSDDLFNSGSSALYTEGNATFPLPQNFNFQVHGGYAWGDFWDDAGGELFDYSIGVGYTYQKLSFLARITGTDASGSQKITSDANNNEARFIISAATTLPWTD